MQFLKSQQKKISKGNCGTGLIANMSGIASHKMLQQGLQILRNLEHRGATGQDPLSGDGAGILLEIPDKFFRRNLSEKIELPIELPAAGNYAVGVFFFSQDKKKSKQQILGSYRSKIFKKICSLLSTEKFFGLIFQLSFKIQALGYCGSNQSYIIIFSVCDNFS